MRPQDHFRWDWKKRNIKPDIMVMAVEIAPLFIALNPVTAISGKASTYQAFSSFTNSAPLWTFQGELRCNSDAKLEWFPQLSPFPLTKQSIKGVIMSHQAEDHGKEWMIREDLSNYRPVALRNYRKSEVNEIM